MAAPALLPTEGSRVLAILAHPDDAEFLCGGTIARLVEEGYEVHYLLVTRGEKGSDDPEMTAARLAEIREHEQRKAAFALGVQSVTFLEGYVDGEVEVTLTLRRELVWHVRKLRPNVVLTFDPWKKDEPHPDHRAVGMCTLDALACARGRMYFPEQLVDGTGPHRVKDIYYFSTDRPNHWVDITSVIDKKIAALRCHACQMLNFDPEEYIRRKGSQAGAEHKYKYAEMFHRAVF
ncbi:PIG-L family deacetylase [Ktedonosporobacter rubrisoli]|uniref:PIG-L family deacetylase n=1 Tax=Ktedonosporobacter rubrisoli TaxID=2509675 RepID=A0A4P6JL70_KTERU|nr:PIG-L deacetylase family protein [Ktedonosporobacter rubrisoli]QBD75760.1 PIG-L family deacetylase [Ktedonosporobacter rubrisoli]